MSLYDCIRVRSQLEEELLRYLEKVQGYADTRLMPGRDERMPIYFEGSDARTPRGVYQWPDVIKRVRRERSLDDGRRSSVVPKEGDLGGLDITEVDEATEIGLVNQDLELKKKWYYQEDTEPKRVPWLDEMKLASRKHKYRALIEGSAGQGKSWLTQQSAARQADEAYAVLMSRTVLPDDLVIPVTLRLSALVQKCKKLWGGDEKRTKMVREAIESLMTEDGCEPIVARFLAQRVGTCKVWLFLDALDESPKGGKLDGLLSTIDEWIGPIVITTRPYASEAVAGHTSWKQHPAYQMAPFNVDQAQSFITQWFSDTPNSASLCRRLRERVRRGDYREVSKSPLLLTLLCATSKNTRLIDIEHPTRGQIYEVILTDIFAQVPEPCNGEEHINIKFSAVMPLLEDISWRMSCKNFENPQISEGDLLELIDRWVEKKYLRYPRGALLETFKKARLLVPEDDTSQSPLVFAHREFGTFLAGAHLARTVNDQGWKQDPSIYISNPDEIYRVFDWLCAAIWDPRTEYIVGFALGLIHNPISVFTTLESSIVSTVEGEELGEDVLGYRLAAFFRCLAHVHLPLEQTRSRAIVSEMLDRMGRRFITEITDTYQFLYYERHERFITPFAICAVRHGYGPQLGRLLSEARKDWFAIPGIGEAWSHLTALEEDASVFLSELLTWLTTSDSLMRRAAARTLGHLTNTGFDDLALLSMIESLLNDESAYVRACAAETLGYLADTGLDISALHFKLSSMLNDEDDSVRLEVVRALGYLAGMGVDVSVSCSKLIALLNNSNVHPHDTTRGLFLRRAVAKTVSNHASAGYDISAFLSQIIEWITDGDHDVRLSASEALGHFSIAGFDFLGPISEIELLLNNGTWYERYKVVKALGCLAIMGVNVSGLHAKLLLLVSDEDESEYVRGAAAVTLGHLACVGVDKPAAVPAVCAFLECCSTEVWASAIEAWGLLVSAGCDVSAGFFKVVWSLKSSIKFVRYDAALALGRAAVAGMDVSSSLSELAELLEDEDGEVCGAAAVALGRFASVGIDVSCSLSKLLTLLQDRRPNVRREVARTLNQYISSGLRLLKSNNAVVSITVPILVDSLLQPQ